MARFRFHSLYLVFALAVLPLAGAVAGPIDKAFEALEMKDYFKAKQLFEKRLTKERLAATYGMCRVFLEQQNPFFNLDSARVYALRTESLFKTATEKERDKVLDYAITQESVDRLRRTVYELALKEVRQANTVEACDRFLERFPASPDKKTVIDLKATLAFAHAKELATPEAYQSYVDSYQGAKEAVEAKVLLERAIYETSTAEGTVKSYHEFIVKYPDSPHRRKAEDRIYALSTDKGTLAQYRAFINANPSNPHVGEAWRKLFQLFAEDYRPETLAEFKSSYPDYPFMDELDADMDLFSRRLMAAREGQTWGFIDRNGKEAIPFRYQRVQPFSEGLAAVQRDGRWGYVDKKGKEVIAPAYDDAEVFRNGIAIVTVGEKVGAVNLKGRRIIPLAFDELLDFEEGVAAFARDGLYGFIDTEGKEVLAPRFDDAWTFSEGRAVVERDGGMGFIDRDGNLVIAPEFEEVESFHKGMSRVVREGLTGIIDRNGRFIVPCRYGRIGRFSEGLAPVLTDEGIGFINLAGAEVIAPRFEGREEDMAYMQFIKGRAVAKRKKLYGIIDTLGKEVQPFRFDLIDPLSDDRYAAKLKGRFGFLNAKGIEVIPYRFDDVRGFAEGKAAVKEKGLWGYINDAGEVVVTLQFTGADSFENGVAVIQKDGYQGLLSESGELLLPAVMDRIDRTEDSGVLRLEKVGRMAYFDINARRYLWSEQGF